MHNYSWPSYSKKEAKLVSEIIASNKVNYLFGKKGAEFEEKFSDFTGAKYSLAVANGTLALDLCLRSIALKKNDEVIVTSRSFVASASCISALGATPVFADVDKNSQNISINEIEKLTSKKTKAIICVHFAGFPCEMQKILKFAKSKNIFVIEDCAQAHGAFINGKSVGTFGHISAWSFCNDKILSTGGEGGMITTNSRKLFRFAESFNNHGKNFTKVNALSDKKASSFPFIHDAIGLNYRLTEMQSAIGIYQLEKLRNWQKLRKRNAEIYIKMFKDIDLIVTPEVPKNIQHAWYKLYLTINSCFLKKGSSRSKIIKDINENGIFCSFGSCGSIYREKAFNKLRYKKSDCRNAYFLETNSILLEINPNIPKKIIEKRAKTIKSIFLKHQI
tara:strand:- start:1897 stop:3066 length:1170 start_codon:yes stop_codon:yes gene_type:complete